MANLNINKLNYLVIIFLMVISACTERIDLDFEEQEYERLVVDGKITTDTISHKVILTSTTNFNYNAPPPPVSNAYVLIEDEDGDVEILEEDPAGSGIYLTNPEYHAIQGKTYTLRITLEEEIGGYRDYEASCMVMPINEIDSIGLTFREDWGDEGFYEVNCYYQDPPTKDFYVFNIFKNGVLLTDTIADLFVTDDEFYNGNYTNGIGVGWLNQAREQEKLYPGDTVTFQAGSITEEYANFIWEVQEETGFSTPLFSGPPANVKSNVNNGAVGFFAAYSVAYSSTTLD